jgi:hypothetical protein
MTPPFIQTVRLHSHRGEQDKAPRDFFWESGVFAALLRRNNR